jgi:hypothetical protein
MGLSSFGLDFNTAIYSQSRASVQVSETLASNCFNKSIDSGTHNPITQQGVEQTASVNNVGRESELKNRFGELKTIKKARIIRRLSGYVAEIFRDETRVCFIEKGNTYFYDFPSPDLEAAGIETINQPFQMDEVQITLNNEKVETEFKFTALAKKSDFFMAPIGLNEKQRNTLSKVLGAKRLAES